MLEICKELLAASSLDALNMTLNNYFSRQDIHSISITYYQAHTKTGSKLIYDWVSLPLKAWHQYYLEQGYADIDRTLEISEVSLLPVFWDVQQQLLVAKNKREHRIRQESLEFGIDKGLSIPVHASQGNLMMLVLHQRHQERGLTHWQDRQYEWLTVAICYLHQLHHYIIPCEEKLSAKLTKREKQCLTLTGQGLRIEAIAHELGVSPRTINFHLQNANKKLGAHNKYFALMRWQQGI